MEVADLLRDGHGYTAGEGHVALPREQALAGQVDGRQRCGAGRLHRYRGSGEIELVGNAGREEIPVGGDYRLQPGHALPELRVGQHLPLMGADAGAPEDADAAAVSIRIVACAL